MIECLDFLKYIYDKFNFKYKLCLSTRHDDAIGDIDKWNIAEDILKKVLDQSKIEYTIKEKDGAFYGPKIDVQVRDVFDRDFQCATIQLDFVQLERFKLEYKNDKCNFDVPVVIHRAILGSFERFIAMIIENYQAKFPFWLSPRQIILIPIKSSHLEYCVSIQKLIKYNDRYILYSYINDGNETLVNKVRMTESSLKSI